MPDANASPGAPASVPAAAPPPDRLHTGPLAPAGPVAVLGVFAGAGLPSIALWAFATSAALLGLAWLHRRGRSWRAPAWLALLAIAASWFVVQEHRASTHDVRQHLADEPQLADVIGVVADEVVFTEPSLGPFAGYDFRPPVTTTRIALRSITIAGEPRPCDGTLMLRIKAVDRGLAPGQRIAATGWLSAISRPSNPGEFDYARFLAQQGVYGRIDLTTPDNYTLLEDAPLVSRPLQRVRAAFAARALASLRLGIDDPEVLGLLERLLLGRRIQDDDTDLDDAFRRVGLAHILSISGAHLSILLGLVWLAARLVTRHPPRMALLVGVVLIVYLLAVPLRVPIIRAAIMAGMFCAGFASGRRVPATDLLSLACLLVLAWRPGDVFTPGFQLSFGVVGALLLFTQPVSERLYPRPQWIDPDEPFHGVVARRLADIASVSLVAFAVAWPLTAYHFQLITPWAAIVSTLALLPVTLVLGVGFVKVFAGMLLPSVALAPTTQALGAMLVGLVRFTAEWPVSAIDLALPPSPLWLILALTWVCLLLWGIARGLRPRGLEEVRPASRSDAATPLRSRRTVVSLAALGVLVFGWLAIAGGRLAPSPWPTPEPGGLSVHAIAVSDGSCFVVRTAGHTLLFDCGSQLDLNVGQRRVLPALRSMGVRRIDTLVISHADLDHYSGVLDVVDAMHVREVVTPEQTLLAAAENRAAASLFDALRERDVPVRTVTAGWAFEADGVAFEALWPPAGFVPEVDNDASLVLRATTRLGRRVLLNGDVQQQAITALLDAQAAGAIDLRADVTDLPHHGSFVDASPAWLDAVSPAVVLQSSGPARLRVDPWPDALDALPARPERLVTAWHGLSGVRIAADGTLTAQTYKARPTPD